MKAAITKEQKSINKAESNERSGDKKIEASLVAAKMHSSIKADKKTPTAVEKVTVKNSV